MGNGRKKKEACLLPIRRVRSFLNLNPGKRNKRQYGRMTNRERVRVDGLGGTRQQYAVLVVVDDDSYRFHFILEREREGCRLMS